MTAIGQRFVFYFADDDSLARVECPAAELRFDPTILEGALVQLLGAPQFAGPWAVAQLARGHGRACFFVPTEASRSPSDARPGFTKPVGTGPV